MAKPNFFDRDSFRSTDAVPLVQPKSFLGCGVEYQELHEKQEAEFRSMYPFSGDRGPYAALEEYRENFTEPGSFTHTPGFKDND